MKTAIKMLGLSTVLALLACDDETARVTADPACQSGVSWNGGDEESPEMHPGRECIGCHAREDEGPSFVAAGTVYGALGEADECYGVGGVLVELTGADGAIVATTTNDAGNFFFESEEIALALPFTARISFEGRERPMATPQADGGCARCHTASGQAGAPGRILRP